MRPPKPYRKSKKTFFRQAFGPIAQGRVDRLKLLSRIVSAGDRRKLLTLKNAETCAKRERKSVMDAPPGPKSKCRPPLVGARYKSDAKN